jgi:hypothetical protein
MVKLQHLAALDTALSRELRDPLATVSSQYCETLSQEQIDMIKRSAAAMGPHHVKTMCKAWLQMIEQYFTDYQEPFPSSTGLKDTLEYMPAADVNKSLCELDWFDSLFPSNTGSVATSDDVDSPDLVLGSMLPAYKLYRHHTLSQAGTGAAQDVAHVGGAGRQLGLKSEPEPEFEPEPEPA